MSSSYSLEQIAAAVGVDVAVQVDGDATVQIQGVGSLAHAQSGQISHFSNSANAAYVAQLAACTASAVIMREADRHRWSGPVLLSDNPYLTYARVTALFVRPGAHQVGVHPSAMVDPDAVVHAGASIGPNVVVGAGSEVADGAVLVANLVVGRDCRIGANSRIHPNATVYDDVQLGERCVVHSNAVLGADGFGYTPDGQGRMVEIAQLGGVRIGDDVSIGASTTIDRGAIDNTRIDSGVKIDNQVQIGHNTHIGAHSLVCGCVGIVGSTTIGKHCVLAGGVGVGGDGPISICDQVIVSGMTHVSRSISQPGVYSGGVLANTSAKWKRNALRFQQLDELVRRVGQLEKR